MARFVFVFISIFPVLGWALVGGVSTAVPSQLCQIVPLVNSLPQSQWSCSAVLVEGSSLKTAGHCGYPYYTGQSNQMVVDCLASSPFVLDKPIEYWTFKDALGPLNPEAKVSEIGRLKLDVATVTLPVEHQLSTAPLKGMEPSTVAKSILAGQCTLIGTGRDELMGWGHPQAKLVRPDQFANDEEGVIYLEGAPYVSAHDSGGALVCDNQYAGTIVAQFGEGSLIAREVDSDKIELQSCEGEMVSEALSRAFVHVMGFNEVREYLLAQQQLGASFCATGITLHKNIYQYFKNLIFIRIHGGSEAPIKTVTVLLQASSIQGHHSTEGRPWIVLDSEKFFSQSLETLLGADVGVLNPSSNHKPRGLTADQLDLLFAKQENEMLERSVVFLDRFEKKELYLVGWLKEVTGGGTNLFAKQFSPQYAVVEVEDDQLKVIKKGGAFNQFLKPAESLLEEANSNKPQDLTEQLRFIDMLSVF